MSNISPAEVAMAFSNNALHLIIMPTEQCNFRCKYCYEDFKIGSMRRPVVDGIKRLLDARVPALHSLHVGWFGGEPLLGFKAVEEISSHAIDLSKRSKHCRFSSEMTTNAYRLDTIILSRLVAVGVNHFQITLDGPKKHHDATRVMKDGNGSFDVIWNNLLGIKESSFDVSVLLRIHVTPSNFPDMPDFIEFLGKEILEDKRFKVLLKAVGHWGGPNDSKFEVLKGAKRVEAVRLLNNQLNGGSGGMVAEQKSYVPGNICYASRPNSLVIRGNGTLAKCTVAFSDPINKVGRVKEDGTLELADNAISPWLHGWKDLNPSSLECPLATIPRPAK